MPRPKAPMDPEIEAAKRRRTNEFMGAIRNLEQINPYDPGQLAPRIETYFEMCDEWAMIPSMGGLYAAICLPAQRVSEIRTGTHSNSRKVRECPESVRMLLDVACARVEGYFEQHFLEGTVNTIAGIFYAKNKFGYRDQVENVVIPVTKEQYSLEEIRARYELPQNGKILIEEKSASLKES